MAREETGKNTTVIIDSLSPLIVTLGLVPVYRFLQRLFAIGREKNARIIILLHKGMHKDEVEVSIRHLAEATLFLERAIEMGEEIFYVDFGKLYSGNYKRIKYRIDNNKVIFDRFTI
jgi:archaellum biogenesis ATPase FlaH